MKFKFVIVVDVLAFLFFLLLASTGMLMHFLLPPGSGAWTEMWGLSRHEWGNIHFWISVTFFSILALHLALHWRFVFGLFRGNAPQASRPRLILGLVGLAMILTLVIVPLLEPVENALHHTPETDSNKWDGTSSATPPVGRGPGPRR